jgi:hypothetical protein
LRIAASLIEFVVPDREGFLFCELGRPGLIDRGEHRRQKLAGKVTTDGILDQVVAGAAQPASSRIELSQDIVIQAYGGSYFGHRFSPTSSRHRALPPLSQLTL